jgi:hypothetical protein
MNPIINKLEQFQGSIIGLFKRSDNYGKKLAVIRKPKRDCCPLLVLAPVLIG